MPYYDDDDNYSYVPCTLTMYQDGGGGDDANSSCGVTSMTSGSSGGVESDDDTSWTTEYSLSYGGGTSVSSSGSDDAANKDATARHRGPSKWLKTLWTIVDRMDGPRRVGADKRDTPQRPVKTILRPPTAYRYVIGMSGCPSKVAVYPRWM